MQSTTAPETVTSFSLMEKCLRQQGNRWANNDITGASVLEKQVQESSKENYLNTVRTTDEKETGKDSTMLKRYFINGNQLIIEIWNSHQCLRNLHEREKRKKPTWIATNQIPSPMLSFGHGYHGCLSKSGKRKKSSTTVSTFKKKKENYIWTEMEPQANHKRRWIWQPSCSPATTSIYKKIYVISRI